jgi:hypothetical protein
MALVFNDHIKPYRMLFGGNHPIMPVFKESATTWKKGAVILYTSGYAVEATDGPTTGTIVGVAAGAASATELEALVYPALPGATFIGRLATGDTGGDLTSLVTHRGVKYGISLEATTGVWYLNAADTSDVAVSLLNFIEPVGTNLCLVEFTFIDSFFNKA